MNDNPSQSEASPKTPKHDLGDPDCLRCMRKKLQAISVGVFFRYGGGWRLGNFEGDKPQDAAEVEFTTLLQQGAPEVIEQKGKPFFLNTNDEVSATFPNVTGLFQDAAVIAAPLSRGNTFGVRLAWRDQKEPFTDEDLVIIRCEGICPEGCDTMNESTGR